jgi:hypothetical protein
MKMSRLGGAEETGPETAAALKCGAIEDKLCRPARPNLLGYT